MGERDRESGKDRRLLYTSIGSRGWIERPHSREADLGGNGLYDALFLGCTQLRLGLGLVLGLGEKSDFRGMSRSCR